MRITERATPIAAVLAAVLAASCFVLFSFKEVRFLRPLSKINHLLRNPFSQTREESRVVGLATLFNNPSQARAVAAAAGEFLPILQDHYILSAVNRYQFLDLADVYDH
jgi:hypothetical protein